MNTNRTRRAVAVRRADLCLEVIVGLGWFWLASGACAAGQPGRSADAHWSFIAPQPALPPAIQDRGWARNPIDRFVLARLEREGLQPSPEADRPTLIRRLGFDLTGLPPDPSEVLRFVEDRSPQAYERLVERLLGSPHFGEHWGRHWLDLARYADSDGYEKDGTRPYAYLYRDWVIQALNRDLPFDEFTIEQLAGDLLPDATEEQKVATGFHRQTLTNREGGVDAEEFRCKAVVDRVSTTGAIWLGLTIGCAECHTHKYDPISQREFYQLYAFFNNASERELPLPSAAEARAHEAAVGVWTQQAAALEAELTKLGADTNTPAWTNAQQRLTKHRAKPPAAPERHASILQEDSKPRQTHIHIRGDFLRQGEPVEPGTLAVLHRFAPRQARPDRLDLARWLMDPANPLTSRVVVNRMWRHLFGRGITPTVEDFGVRGEPPSHPELLDWLAAEFPRRGWSQKSLIRLIVTSATYRQSSRPRPELGERDPLNSWLARQNRFRLDAENVRDACLAVSGLLEPQVGGPGIRPPLPPDIAAIAYANSVKWKESEGADRYRRGLYIFFQRTVPYPMLTTFDAPDSNVACTRRERSNTPLQALALLNDSMAFECAQALGRRLHRGAGTARERIRQAFAACLSREPTSDELGRLELYYETHRRLSQADLAAAAASAPPDRGGDHLAEQAACVALARTILNLDEFVTRE